MNPHPCLTQGRARRAAPNPKRDDVLESFGLAGGERTAPALSRSAQAVLARLGHAPASADELVRALATDAAMVAAALAELDLHELLTESSGIYRAGSRP